jgi:cysteine desulfurase
MSTAPLVYLDHAATTPVRPEVRAAMEPYWTETFGNPSSSHAAGRAARRALEDARARLAAHLGVGRRELVFTGGGTEADNLAVLGFVRRHRNARVLHSAVEHKAVWKAAEAAAREGAEVVVVPVDAEGVVRLDALEAELRRGDGRPTLVSVMWANNETGVLQPVDRIAELCRAHGARFHTDAVQAFGKVRVRADEVGADLVALSAHKIGGPKGIGALVVRDGVELEPLLHGGGHEFGLRSGTPAVPLAVGFAAAADRALADLAAEAERWRALRDRLEAGLRERVPDLRVNGAGAPRLPNLLNVSLAGVAIDALLLALDLEGIAVSSGSACTTGAVEPSHVLVAMGLEGPWAENSLRWSLGWSTRAEEIDRALDVAPRVIRRVRGLAGAPAGAREGRP